MKLSLAAKQIDSKTMSFDKLPAELLAIIFKNYIRSEGHAEFFTNVIPVCTKWRGIGLSFPSLCKIVDITHKKDMTQRYLPQPALESLKWGLPVTEELSTTDVWFDQRVSEVLFSGCPNLTSLSLSNCRVHATTFALVAQHCKKLESIALDSVNQNGKTISQRMLEPIFVVGGPNLKRVSMSNPMFHRNDLECEVIAATIIDSCSRLEQLTLSIPPNKQGKPIFLVDKLRTSSPKLRALRVEGYSIYDLYAPWQTDALQNLEQLELISVLNIPGIFNILRNAEKLKQLTLIKVCASFVGESSIHCIIKSKGLEKLHLVDVMFQQSDLLGLVQRYRHSLKELTLIDKWTVDRVLLVFATENKKSPKRPFTKREREPSLEVLNLSIPRLRISVLAQVVRECTRLRSLDTSNCSDLPVAYRWKLDTIEKINLVRDSLPILEVTDDE